MSRTFHRAYLLTLWNTTFAAVYDLTLLREALQTLTLAGSTHTLVPRFNLGDRIFEEVNVPVYRDKNDLDPQSSRQLTLTITPIKVILTGTIPTELHVVFVSTIPTLGYENPNDMTTALGTLFTSYRIDKSIDGYCERGLGLGRLTDSFRENFRIEPIPLFTKNGSSVQYLDTIK